MSRLLLSRSIYDAIRAHGEQTYPHECCGALLGRYSPADTARNEPAGWLVESAVPAGNTRTDSAHNRYNIAPQELIRAQREARQQGLDIVGFYHSHPDHPAQYSPTDFAEAHWFNCAYVITAIEKGHAQITNSFLLTGTTEEDKAFTLQAIAIS
jgi:proteasome lid subunit RPN8/RPN11